MKVLEYAPSWGITLTEARFPTEEEKVGYADWFQKVMLIGSGKNIKLDFVTWEDLDFDLFRSRGKTYSFLGTNNSVWEISDEEWDSFLSLNAQRIEQKKQKDLEEEIAAYRKIISKAEAQRDIPTRQEAKRRIKQYNDIHNEGGYGFVPQIIDIDQYNAAKSRLAELGG